jgi:pimeloyl-ACP methyl ester carboxylesterase
VENPHLLSLPELGAACFADPTGPVATMALTLPEDPEALGEALIAITWAMGVAAKFWWPIPDRGLHKRIHRIAAPTLVIWGEQDGLISPDYAHDFGRLISNSRVELLADAAHVPQLERYDVVPEMVEQFLAG